MVNRIWKCIHIIANIFNIYLFLPHILHLDMVHKYVLLFGNLVDTHLHKMFLVQNEYLWNSIITITCIVLTLTWTWLYTKWARVKFKLIVIFKWFSFWIVYFSWRTVGNASTIVIEVLTGLYTRYYATYKIQHDPYNVITTHSTLVIIRSHTTSCTFSTTALRISCTV